MNEVAKNIPRMPRREFLRGVGAGAMALGTGQLVSGCGGGGGVGGAVVNTPLRIFVSTFLAASVLEIRTQPDGSALKTTFKQFDPGVTTAGIVVGPNNNLFVFSPFANRIFMLDINTGATKRIIEGTFLNTCHDGSIGPDGLLYAVNGPSLSAGVGSSRIDSIERFDASTGDRIGTFVDVSTVPEVRGPFGILWGPDGDLYVASALSYGFNPGVFPFRPDHIARLDGRTGAFKGFVVRATHLTFTMAFHADGRLLVPSHFFNRVFTYDTTNSRQLDSFVDVPFPIGVRYAPDGDFYVASFSDQDHLNKLLDLDTTNDAQAEGAGSILRFDGSVGGRAKATVISSLPYAGFLAFA